jgi:hypothetical protein
VKELIYSNFQLTRSTGVPTMVVVDGVSIEMRKQGAVPARAKAKKPRRPGKKASGEKPKKPRAREATSKAAPVRRTEAAPQYPVP